MEHPIAGPEYKPSLSISTKEVDLPNLGIDDTGTLILKFKVTGANKYTDEDGDEYITYNMEYEISNVKVKPVSLQEATRRAVDSEDIYVKTQSNPAPG